MQNYKFADFKSDFEKKMISFAEAMAAFPWEDERCYAQWLAHSYYYVSHSTRLLAMAAGRTALDQESLHKRFVAHLGEEKGHEKIAISDMKRIGFRIEDSKELPETALFYQNQYYWLTYHGATAFLGWIIALEGGAVHGCPSAYARVVKKHGKEAGIFLKIHAEEDVDHLEKALEQIQDLSSQELRLIAKNLEQSCEIYWSVLKRIAAKSDHFTNKNVA